MFEAKSVRESVREYQQRIVREVSTETYQTSPISRFRYIAFTSTSKGRGRKGRKYPTTIELVKDLPNGKTYSWEKCPFDDWATETLGRDSTERDLMKKIQLECRYPQKYPY